MGTPKPCHPGQHTCRGHVCRRDCRSGYRTCALMIGTRDFGFREFCSANQGLEVPGKKDTRIVLEAKPQSVPGTLAGFVPRRDRIWFERPKKPFHVRLWHLSCSVLVLVYVCVVVHDERVCVVTSSFELRVHHNVGHVCVNLQHGYRLGEEQAGPYQEHGPHGPQEPERVLGPLGQGVQFFWFFMFFVFCVVLFFFSFPSSLLVARPNRALW
jgi:hypothetical protein